MSYADSSGTPIAYRARGAGTPVLLIAGTAQGGDTWPEPLLDVLAQTHTVLTYDNRATGRTAATDGDYSTRQFATDAAAVLDAVAEGPAHVVGHSMGGRVAQWLTLDRPELVRTLTLAATGPGALSSGTGHVPDFPRGIPLGLAVALAQQGYETFFRDRIRATFFTTEQLTSRADVVDATVEAILREAPDVEGYLKHVAARQNHQTADLLDRIRTPTLVLYGDADTFPGFAGSHTAQSEFLVEHIPGARRAVLSGEAHGFFWTVPERSAQVLTGWWQDVATSGR